MIGPEDIEAFAPDLEVADKIVSRAMKGATKYRHIRSDEEMPLIRAYFIMRDLAQQGASFMAAQKQASLDGMACFDENGRRAD